MSAPVSTLTTKEGPEAAFGFRDFVRVVERRGGLIRTVTLAVVVLTAAVMYSLPTLYTTSATVMLDQRKNTVADASTVLSALPTDPSSVQNQLHVLASRDLALTVIDKLHLEADPEFNPALGGGGLDLNPLHWLRGHHTASGASGRDLVVSNFLSHLDVSQLGVSTSIDVAVTSKDPEKAARIANALAESYTQGMVSTKVAAARKAAGWLNERMHQLALQVQQQEAAIEQYKSENNLVDAQPGASLVDQQLMAINTQLVNAQSDLAEKKAAYDRVAALSKTGNTADVTPVVTSKMIGDLRTQEAELVRQEADMASRYGPNHPKMVAIRNEKRDLSAKIAREVDGIAGSMQSELEVAKAHVASIQASLARVSRQARQDNQARIKLSAMEANLASTRTAYESFVQRLRAVQDQDDIQLPEAEVISSAPVPAAPSAPKRALFIGASIPGGILLGLLLALVLERFGAAEPVAPVIRQPAHSGHPAYGAAPAFAGAQTYGTPAYAAPPYVSPAPAAPAYRGPGFAEPAMAQPTPTPTPTAPRRSYQVPTPAAALTPVPLPPVLSEVAASPDMRLADWVLDNPASPYALALDSLLRDHLTGQRGGRVVALTAPAADPGKAVLALALARVAALRGLRTVLLDADLGRLAPSSQALTGQAMGISGVLQGQPLSSQMLKDRRTHAYVMAAAPTVWPDRRMAGLIDHLRRHSDLVLIDAASPLTVGPWPALARLSDSVLVYAQARQSEPVVQAALRSLVAMGAPTAGLIVAR